MVLKEQIIKIIGKMFRSKFGVDKDMSSYTQKEHEEFQKDYHNF